MGVEINTETETDHLETIRKHENNDTMSYKNKSEKELLHMIAKDTNRTAKNVAFYFWITIISVAYVAFTLLESL